MFPEPTPETAEFWAGAAAGQLRMPYCRSCNRYYFYPRPFCRYCASTDVEWRVASGKGRLISYVINHRPVAALEGTEPRIVALVELDEGPRMMSNIVDVAPDPKHLPLDAAVEVSFETRGDKTIPVFRMAVNA
jgi:uncharacterized OB-fold protein